MRTSSSERPPTVVVPRLGRRQSSRVFGELGCNRRGAAIARDPCCLVEHPGNLRVWRIARQREVTGAEDRIVDDRCDPRVNGSPLLAHRAVEERGQERMSEADDAVIPLDHVCRDCRSEHAYPDSRTLEERFSGGTERRRKRESLTRDRGKGSDPRANELVERLGNCEGRERVSARITATREL